MKKEPVIRLLSLGLLGGDDEVERRADRGRGRPNSLHSRGGYAQRRCATVSHSAVIEIIAPSWARRTRMAPACGGLVRDAAEGAAGKGRARCTARFTRSEFTAARTAAGTALETAAAAAQLTGDQDAARAAAADMAAAIRQMGPNALPEHRILAHYDLAKFWSGHDDRRTAFAHWQEGHKLLRLSQPFARETFARFLDQTRDAFSAERFRSGAFASNQDPAPVFIIGMPCSGTTLCEEILAAHALVHGAGERDALHQMARTLGTPEQIALLPAAELDGAAARYLAELHALAPGKTRIVDKMPGNEMYLGLAALMLPGAKFIHCVRDPRDIGLSIWTYRFHGEHAYAHDLADLGWTIGQRARLVDHWRQVLPGRILTLALKDWVDDFDGTLARVLGHLDLSHDPACARFYENNRDVRTVSRAQVRQPVHARGLGRWRAYAAELAPLIAELKAAGMLSASSRRPRRDRG